MKTVLKVMLGIVLGCTVLIVGCAALLSGVDTTTTDDNPSAATETTQTTQSDGSSPPPPPSKSVTFGKQSASGEFAIAQTSGTIDSPEVIRVRVKTTPEQSVLVSYTLVCSTGASAGTDSGQFSAKTPVDRKIDVPNGKPDSCMVSANAQMEGPKGTIEIKLRGIER
ncbi:MAG: hypothetical protein WKF96_16540 [Solirubrobacteraceae bacterium]